MNKKTSSKFYIHHKRFFVISERKTFKKTNFIFALFFLVGNFVVNFFSRSFYFLENICYQTGLKVINFFYRSFILILSDIKNTSKNFEKRVIQILRNKTVYSLSIFLFICLSSWLAIRSLGLVAKGLDLKNRLVNTALVGNLYLNQAKESLINKDISAAQTSFTRAYNTFNKGKEDILASGQLLNSVLGLVPQKKAADKLLEAASLISETGNEMLLLDGKVKEIKLGPSGLIGVNTSIPEALNEIEKILYNANQKVYLAHQLVNSVDLSLIPKDKQQIFISSLNQLKNAKDAFTNLNQIYKLSKNILLGQKEVLVLFQNNNELRATGGFIGTYGRLKINNGILTTVKISSIYDLDGQLTQQIKPPKPLLNLGPRWFMRDSNWFANFPKSAKKISDFYEMEAGLTPDLVIAITPNLISDLLKVTGPVYLPKYNVTLTAENFVEQTQVFTTLSNDLPTNSPKQILADLFPVLINKISNLSSENVPELILILQNQLSQKQIALYSRDPEIQNLLKDFGFTGEIEKTDRDYLAIVSSNLSGTKTDLNIEQNIKLETKISEDGKIINTLLVSRKNKLPNLNSTENTSYIRIFVPLGSKLIESTGFDYLPLEYPNDIKYKVDSDVLDWEKNSVTDNLTGTRIGVESGKTIFSNWVKVNGGETKTVSVTYELPFKLAAVDRYSLFAQKQLGAEPSMFNWLIKFNSRNIEWKNFDPVNMETNLLTTDLSLNKDLFLGLVFKKD